MTADVIVCGLGPAGRALAHRCLAHGLSVTAIDPFPDRYWTATYGAWEDELPGWLDPAAVAVAVDRPTAWGSDSHRIERRYTVLDTMRLHDCLGVDGARVIADRVIGIDRGSVRLRSGAQVRGARIIDARGIGRSPALAEQTAYGVIVAADRSETLFMDWRPDNGAHPDAPPSFLYAVPLGGDAMLLEETCLAGRPALDGAVLQDRLEHRLRSRGIELSGSEPVERVRFPVQGGRPGRSRFGAAGGFTHPATGYSVAAALAAADTVAAGASAWPVTARAVRALRIAGLRALLDLPPVDIRLFFDAFFALPPELQHAYLSGRTDLRGTVDAMRTLFAGLPPRLRRRIAAATLRIPLRSQLRMASAIIG